uniref:zinc-ribbon domain-containing protein n=1 Tax=Kocuria sp. CH-021 TaxID=3406735 RepID=UPI003C7474CB
MPVKTQECSRPRCGNDAAYTTRTKPAWCTGCIDDLLRVGGLKADEPFPGPGKYRLCTCLECGVQAHYKFDYVLEKNGYGEKTCRACHWQDWAQHQRELLGYYFESALLELLRDGFTRDEILTVVPTQPARQFLDEGVLPVERIAERLDAVGLDLVDPLGEIHDHYDPVVVRCRRCGKISAARPCDFGSGCTCSSNPRGTPAATAGSNPNLFVDSGAKALTWWDHEKNSEADFRTVTVRATRTFHWTCPDCRHPFQASVNDMTRWLRCPRCEDARREAWNQEYERWKVTPIATVPVLLAAWADEEDPHQAMVGGHGLRRFRCPEGHYARVGPLTYMDSGCPSCRGARTKASSQKRWLADTLPEIATQWHPTKNGKHTPHNVVWDSKRTVWWRDPSCGHEWQDTVRARDKYERWRCPQCRTILGSLAWHDPGLAAEWSPANPKTAWQVRPHASTPFVPEWICATAEIFKVFEASGCQAAADSAADGRLIQ